jgi:voltage-gated potassium channel
MSVIAATKTPCVRCRRPWRVRWLYFVAMLREFRWTFVILLCCLALGALIYSISPDNEGHRPTLRVAVYGAWMSMLGEPIYLPPTWYLSLVNALFPLVGVAVIGEGVVRFALLMVSRREGEKEWMRVMASTYNDHVVLCGIGHLGFRVLEQLVAAAVPVVVLEKDENARNLAATREMGVPVILRDMKEDQALIDAGIARARAVIIATNDDMANLEVALDARRLNKSVRVVMRLFDQQIASKISGALSIDVAFSSSTLAAPIVAALSLETKVLSTTVIAGVPHVTAEMVVAPAGKWAKRRLSELEAGYAMRVLALSRPGQALQSPPHGTVEVEAGDMLVVHAAATQLSTLTVACRAVEAA